jgi:hypothetical protein
LSSQFTEHILEARRPRLAAEREGTDKLREIKWSHIGKGDYEAYKRVIDTYFDFVDQHNTGGPGSVEFHCTIVLTQVRERPFSGARGKKNMNYEYWNHCLNLAIYHKYSLFHIYLDRRHSDDAEAKSYDQSLRRSLRSKLINMHDSRDNAVRKVQSHHSHEFQGLQIADLLIGAVAFRLNRHYEADAANADKKQLCEYILRKGDLWEHINADRRTYREKKFGRFQLWQQRPKEALANPPKPKKAT